MIKSQFRTLVFLCASPLCAAASAEPIEQVEVKVFGETFICPIASATYVKPTGELWIGLKETRPHKKYSAPTDESTVCHLKPTSPPEKQQ